jgi:OOP family OmpA-OmpF porin
MRTLLALCIGLASAAAGAQQTSALVPNLTPPPERISDRAIQADYASYEAVQARIKALNDRGLGKGPRVASYHLAKAQCWLDASFHEYTRNDRSAYPQQALEQADRLIVLMEQSASPLPDDTPLVNDADRLRPDLWEATARLKAHPGFRCAAQRTACAEVELVHAGNEHKQLGWRHAKPYVQMAEDLVADAQLAAERCIPPTVAQAPPPPPPPPPKPEPYEFSTAVLFTFGEGDAAGIRPMTRERLDQTILRARQADFKIEKITVTGHADRLNGTGKNDFNQRLSLRRAQTVADLLVAAGLDRSLIVVSGKSDSMPVEACASRAKTTPELEECLAPNRRVEVDVSGTRMR